MEIEIFEVYNQGGVFPVRLFASKGILNAVSSLDGKVNLKTVVDSLEETVFNDRFEQIGQELAIVRFSCFQPSWQGTKLLMITALFHDNPSCIYLFLDEELKGNVLV